MTRALAYRLQERALGGLKRSTRQLRDRIGAGRSSSPLMRVAPHRKTAPGTVLVRVWRGTRHRVIVLDDVVIYRGRPYRSLSEGGLCVDLQLGRERHRNIAIVLS